MTLRISVVLPAPLRPTRPTMAPSGTVEAQAAQRLDVLDADVQRLDLQHRAPYSASSSPVT